MSENRRMKISDLRSHPKNAEIYGSNEDVSDLIEKIKRSGQVHTLVVTSNGTVLAGHRRMKACKELGIDEVDVEIRDFDTQEQEIEYIIDNNATREKTNEQKAREAIVLKETLSILAEKRKLNKLKQNQSSDMPKLAQRFGDSVEMPNSALRGNEYSENGKTRDIIASKVGFKSGQEVDRGMTTVKKIDKLKEEGRIEDANLISGVLNNRSVSAAESLAKNIDNVHIPQEDRASIQSGCKSPNSYIKKSKMEKDLNSKAEIFNDKSSEAKINVNNFEDELSKIQERYSDYLRTFQEDISWLLTKEFIQDEEVVTKKIHSDLQNCLEKFKDIKNLIENIQIDDLDDTSILVNRQ